MTTTSVSRRIAWWSFLAMVFVVPLAMSDFALPGVQGRLSFSSVDMVKLSLVIILTLVSLAAWAYDLLRNGGRVRHTPIDWLVLAWLIWAVVATVASVHWQTAFMGAQGRHEGLITFVTYAAVYFLALQMVGEGKHVLRLAQTLLCSSAIVAAYGLLQYAGLIAPPPDLPWDEAERAFATFGNPNMLGGFLVLTTAIALGLALHERRLGWRLVCWVGFGLNGLGLLVTFTRGSWIGGAVSLVLLGIIAWRQRTRLRRADWIPGGLFAAAGVALIVRSLSSAADVTNLGKRLASIFDFDSGSSRQRGQIWQAAVDAIKERPLFGWGPDTFSFAFQKHKSLDFVREAGGSLDADNAHDYPLHLASGVGIFGAVLFFGIWVWAGIRSFKTVFSRSEDPDRVLVGAFWAAAAGYLLHLVFGISAPGSTFLLWVALAVVLAPTARVSTLRPLRHWVRITASTAAILLAAVGIAGQSVVLAADSSYMAATEKLSGRPLAGRLDAADRAVTLNPVATEHRSALAALRREQMSAAARALAQAQGEGRDPAPYRDDLARAFEAAEQAYLEALAFRPLDYAGYVNLATVYNLAGETLDPAYYQQAIDTAVTGLEVEPLGTAIRKREAVALAAIGRDQEAVQTLEYCLALDPRDAEAALALARLYQDQGKVAEAIGALRSVEGLSPGQAGVAEAIRTLETGGSLP